MEKVSTMGSKKTQDDSIAGEKSASGSDVVDSKKEQVAVKLEKEEVAKNEGIQGNQKKDRNPSSVEPKAPSRSTRSSNNPEFVAKQRHFLQKVNQGVFYQSSEEEGDSSVTNGQTHMSKRKRSVSGGFSNIESGSSVKSNFAVDQGPGSNSNLSASPSGGGGGKAFAAVKKRKYEVDGLTRDIYCWVCHREMGSSSGGSSLSCEVCPRVYHARCCHNMDPGSPYASSSSPSSTSNSPAPSKKGWACPECVKIVRAETMGTRSRAMQLLTMDQLCTLLKFVLTRGRSVTGAEPFYGAVDLQQFPRYREYVANPMDLGLIDRNIRRRTYGSTEAFFADMKWIVHNSIIFNTQHSKLTSIARSMLKISRQELVEIENCPDCYSNAHTRKDNWFIDVCRRPHILVWAKLKGFPHWPAKAMRINKEGCIDVRFFGAHDRAWVPARDCFLYSREMPAPPKNRKKNNFDGCIMEVEDHIKKLKEKFGVFVYAPLRTVFDPSHEDEILAKILPKYQPINLDNPSNYNRENLQEERISRESPAISTGTEEESDRDQSLDEDETSVHKEIFDATFEESVEAPSGQEGSQSLDKAPSSSEVVEEVGKTAKDVTLEGESCERTKQEVDAKDAAGKEEADVGGEEEGGEEKAKGGGKMSGDKKERAAGASKKGEATKEVKEDEEGTAEVGDGEVMLIDVPDQVFEVKRDLSEVKPDDREEESGSLELACKNQADTGVIRGSKDGQEGEKEIRLDAEATDNEAEITKIGDSDVLTKGTGDEDSGIAKVAEDGETTGSTEENDEAEVRLKKDALEEPIIVTEEKEKSSVSPSSISKAVEDPVKSQTDASVDRTKGSHGSKEDGIPPTDVEKDKETVDSEGIQKDSLGDDEAKDGDTGKLGSSGDQDKGSEKDTKSLEEDEIEASASSNDKAGKAEEPLGPVKNHKSSGAESSEESCDKAENNVLDRDGEADRAKLFQSLRLVNIETLYKHDVREAIEKKVSAGEDGAKADDTGPVNQADVSDKIDVNKLRESLMTKCANSTVSGNDLGNVPPEFVAVQSSLSVSVEGNQGKGETEATKKEEVLADDDDDDTSDTPATIKNVVTSPTGNKGDVGSQLSILGKLQQRLSFIKEAIGGFEEESTQEQEDENTIEDAESETGDASRTSNSEDEDVATPKDGNLGAEQEGAAEKLAAVKDDDDSVAEDRKSEQVKGAESPTKEDEKIVKNVEEDKEKIEKSDKSQSVGASDDDGVKKNKTRAEVSEMDVEEVPETLGEKSDIKTGEAISSEESVEKVSENLVQGKKSSAHKGKVLELTDSSVESPVTAKKPKLMDTKDSESLKHRASPLKVKSEEVIEEEVLNREVLKESNMVVVQKTVKTRRLDEESSGGSAPKRARKGIAQKALIADRSDSPAQDEVFPSMFLDPSVTITVLQESEKENGGSKESSSGSTNVDDLRTSVNLSNDVSLTMVRPAGGLEGLAAMQDGAVSKSSDQSQVDFSGLPPPSSGTPGTNQFRPRARKSFPRPCPRINARSPQSLNLNSSSMEVRRMPANSRDIAPVSMSGGTSLLRTTPCTLAPMPTVAMRVLNSQSPMTSVPFSSSSTFSTPSTSQPLVHSTVSQMLPSASLVVANPQSSSGSPRPPNLHTRTPTYPLSGPQQLFPPAEAGPLSAEFSKHAHKLACYMRHAIEDILGDLSRMGNPEAAIKLLRLEVEKLRWEHQQEIAELKHNQDLVIMEMKTSLEKEKVRLVNEVRRHCETEKLRAIEETKRKQWCANCSKEALFYCCWNTSYCDYPCQQAHWPRHMSSCAQNNGMPESGDGDSGSSGNRKDGSSGGHRGAAPPPAFHQLQRPGGVTQESQPEEEYYDEDSNSASTPRTTTSGGTYRVKRRRCGLCKGCLVKNNCGSCAPCRNSKTHQVCRMRQCRSLQSDWVASGSSRTVSPEPGSTNVSLETPPLTYASKNTCGGTKPSHSQPKPLSSLQPTAPLSPPHLLGFSNVQQRQLAESLNSSITGESTSGHATQSAPHGGAVASNLLPQSHPKGLHQASSMDPPHQSVFPSAPPSLHLIHPSCSGFPESYCGNERCSVVPMYTHPNTPQLQPKNLLTPTSSNNQNVTLPPNPEVCASQAVVPYCQSNDLQLSKPLTTTAPKPPRSRKGHPQRSGNNQLPIRNAYLQPPHFIRQLSGNDEKPIDAQPVKSLPQLLEIQSQSTSLLPQSFLSLPNNLTHKKYPIKEKSEVLPPPNICPQTPYTVPLPPNYVVPFMNVSRDAGCTTQPSNLSKVIPNCKPHLKQQKGSLQHSTSHPRAQNYYSLPSSYLESNNKSIAEVQRNLFHSENQNSQAVSSNCCQQLPKHDTQTQQGDSTQLTQYPKTSSNENSGPSNAVLHLPNFNAAFLGSGSRSLSNTQNTENLAALPPNFYPQTTLSQCNTPSSSCQTSHTKPIFLNPHYQSANIPNSPVFSGNCNDSATNRNPLKQIPSGQRPSSFGVRNWASDFQVPTQNSYPQPCATDSVLPKSEAEVFRNHFKPPNSSEQLPNFNATFLSRNLQHEHLRPTLLASSSGQPAASTKLASTVQRQPKPRAERYQRSNHGPSTFKSLPDNTLAQTANYHSQLSYPQNIYPPDRVNTSNNTASQPYFPENSFYQRGNPFPLPTQYPSHLLNSHGSGPHSPAEPQQSQHPFPPIRGSCMAILSATSIIMPPPPPNPPSFLFPPPFQMAPAMMVRQHQIHRQQLAAGLDLFAETLRNASDPTRKL